MIKLQQFNVFSLKYERIMGCNFAVDLSIAEARENEELIALADNEVLRVVREITRHSFNAKKLRELVHNRKKISRSENTDSSKDTIAKINTEIDNLLFVKDFVSIEFENVKNYNKLNKTRFTINGQEFKWLMCGAGHQRTNRAMYVTADIYDKVNNVLVNGAELKDMVLAKYNAYYALYCSATYKVTMPKVCVISDCVVERVKTVDFAKDHNITRCEKNIKFDLFDGQGLVSPKLSKIWSNDIGIYDYIPSAWGVRSSFLKGMCVTFDFHAFAKYIAKKDFVVDVWGQEHKISDIDVIISQSQFKLWNSYSSWSEYEANCIKNNLSWGISKVSPSIEEEKTFMLTNYQFLQVLELSDNDIVDLCKPTVEWLNGVACGDLDKTELYLLGNIANKKDAKKAFDNVQDSFLKCLLLDKSLLQDNYVKNRIVKSINKKIRESYFGNLIIDGNFMARISDPYAQCEHMFGMEVKGLLAENEHYSYFWNNKKVDTVVAMRSPLTYKTEAHKLYLQNNKEQKEWYEYLTSGVVYNIFGVDCLLEAGADYDFDIVATTDNKYFLKGILGTDIPVVYDAKLPKKEKISYDKLVEVAGLGFNTQIGYLTNLSTTLYSMQSLYEKGSVQWEEIEKRLKLCCELQSMQIDKAKGLEIDDIPSWWVSFREALKKDGGAKGLNCELLIESRPYFMRYRYSKYNTDYKNKIADVKRYCTTVWGTDYYDICTETEDYQKLLEYYSRKCKLIKNVGIMNRICNHLEKELKSLKSSSYSGGCSIYSLLWDSPPENEEITNKLLEIREEYLAFKKNKAFETSEYVSWEQYFKAIRDKCFENISSNIKELGRHSAYICYEIYKNKPKDFVWDCFGRGLLLELMTRKDIASMPILSDFGNIEYLGKMYWRTIIDLYASSKESNSLELESAEIVELDIENDNLELWELFE